MKKKRLLIDMDSVTVDLMKKWHEHYNRDYDDTLSVAKIHSWDMHKFVKKECGTDIYGYLNQKGFFRDLDPLPNAIRILEELNKDFEIFLVTASPVQAMEDKLHWVEEHLSFLDHRRVVFTHHKHIIEGDLLFDDAPHNLQAFQESGKLAVAMDYPYNRTLSCPRVRDWLEFKKFVYKKWGRQE